MPQTTSKINFNLIAERVSQVLIMGENLGKVSYLLIGILLILNVVFRYPVTPHEIGSDSFLIHVLAQSITTNGYAKWIIHPLSSFGLYPYSYASGLPHILAVSSIITGIEMEWNIYLTSLLFGLFGVFTAFTLAGEFSENFCFKYLVAFIFSTSPIALKFTLWTVSTRGLFLMLLPLFIWSLIKVHKTRSYNYLLISLLLILSLATIHKMFVLIALIFMGYLLAVYCPRSSKIIKLKYSPHTLLFIYIVLFFSSFIYIRNSWVLQYVPFQGVEWYHYLIGTIFTMGARLGLLVPFALIGLINIIFKSRKSISEWFLIYIVLLFTPLLGHSMYFYQILLPFISILSAIGLLHIVKRSEKLIEGKYFIFILLILLVFFSWFTLEVRYTNIDSLGYTNYMREETYSLANFIQKEVKNQNISCVGVGSRRIAAFVDDSMPITNSIDYVISGIIDKHLLNVTLNPLPRSLRETGSFVRRPFTPSLNGEIPERVVHYRVITENDDHIYRTNSTIYDNNFEELWLK